MKKEIGEMIQEAREKSEKGIIKKKITKRGNPTDKKNINNKIKKSKIQVTRVMLATPQIPTYP